MDWRTLQRRLRPLVISSVLLILVLIWAFPLAPLPAPRGEFNVGTATFAFTSKDQDMLLRDRSKFRELAVQVWYPTNQSEGETAPDMFPFKNLSPFFQSPLFAAAGWHLTFVHTHSFLNAPLSKQPARFPVVIFSHGLMGWRGQNTMQMEWLASHGFVVLAPDHTYDAAFAVFPDGHIITSQLLAGKNSPDQAALKEVDFEQRVKDIEFLIGELTTIDANDPQNRFTNRLDLKNIAVIGHSMGGRAALSISQQTPLKAALSYDGSPTDFTSPLCPVMVLQAEREGDPLGVKRLYLDTNKFPIFNIKVNKAGHANFTDLPLLTKLHWLLGMSGSINQFDAERVINLYTLYFLSKYLRGFEEDFSTYKIEGVSWTKWLPPRKVEHRTLTDNDKKKKNEQSPQR